MSSTRQLRIVAIKRRGRVLRHPLLPCLARYHTLNLTAGCPNECFYCYSQSYEFVPSWGTVAYYENTLERLRAELPRMKKKPELVYFSTYSEPFLPIEQILSAQFEIMKMLLEQKVRVLISTKGKIPHRFVSLFAEYPGMVHVQVGITTVNDRVRELIEPNASSVDERLDNLKRLRGSGVSVEARIDPLIPGLTDGNESLDSLMREIVKCGVRDAVASYLFLRWGIYPTKEIAYGDWSFRKMRRLYTLKVTDYCGNGIIWLPPTEYRRERYQTLKKIAGSYGVRIKLCRCKNRDLTDECCHPVPPGEQGNMQQLRFL
ncbi:radical SAM protein [Candidatus Sumerlaeota bacterium]|nr:radical SAM protein [Candidatus Sumerlaeota bacterium]